MVMTDTARNLIRRLSDALDDAVVVQLDDVVLLLDEARAYLEETEPQEQISEEENEVRFKECLKAINNLKPGEITELMGEAFMEEFRRVSQ
jgi:hypothetical protein